MTQHELFPRRFVILALPRSRTAWLSRWLSYGDWTCGHDELRHCRSLDDVRSWLAQPCTGSVETTGAPWWRLLEQLAPDARVAIVRRPVEEVLASLMRQRLPGLHFDAGQLRRVLQHLDRKLEQAAGRLPGALSLSFADLATEANCARLFEHCLPFAYDPAHWRALAPVNIQINLLADLRYTVACRPQLEKLAKLATQAVRQEMLQRHSEPELAGVTLQQESFDSWIAGAQRLFDAHLCLVGEAPGDWQQKNLPRMAELYASGNMLITTARCNGRMVGYLMTLLAPSLAQRDAISAYNTTLYAAPEFPGVGLRLERAAVEAARESGASELFMQDGTRGSGGRINAIYRRLGAECDGQIYRLALTEH